MTQTVSASPVLSAKPASDPKGTERLIVGIIGSLTILLTNIAWIFGCLISAQGERFVGAVYNISDFYNYMSWLQQTSRGQFILHNLFTTDPQNPRQCNILFILLGWIVRGTGLSPALVYQSCRLIAGIVLLSLLWRFIQHCFPKHQGARIAAFCFVCFGNGFGWLTAQRWADKNPPGSPIEGWQPEAFTFQSLETSTLFCVSTVFILGAMALLIAGETRKQIRYAVGAGLCLATLGNIHTYDVLHVAAAWSIYLVARTILIRDADLAGSWIRAITALVIMLPTVVYEFYAYLTDPIFHQRVGVQTLSPAFWSYLLGYAPLLILTAGFLICAVLTRAQSGLKDEGDYWSPFTNRTVALAMVSWAIGGLAAAYLPHVSFQRKMLMGEHIPLCVLAGAGAAGIMRLVPGWRGWIPFAACFAISIPSALLFTARDVRHLMNNRSEEIGLVPFIDSDTDGVLSWIQSNTSVGDKILGNPILAGIVPAETGRMVWSGHWGETPQYATTVADFLRFADVNASDTDRMHFLAGTHCDYLNLLRSPATNPKGWKGVRMTDFSVDTPPYLTLVYSNKSYVVYRINRSLLQ